MRSIRSLILTAAFLGFALGASAQVSVHDGTGTDPNASAMLDVQADDSGVLIPRMTEAQRNAIASPATSLLIYQTNSTPGYYYNSGTPGSPVWERLALTSGTVSGTGVATRVAFWNTDNSLGSNADLYWDNGNGRLGIGTDTPSDLLHVDGIIRIPGAEGSGYQIRAAQNATTGVSVRATDNPSAGENIFTVEPSGSQARFGVTQSNGIWARDGMYIGGQFDSGLPDMDGGLYVGGNVGIGNIDPNQRLVVDGTIRSTGLAGGGNTSVYATNDGDLTTSAPVSGIIGFWQRNGINLAPATIGDNVGLGTTAPWQKLDIVGTTYLRAAPTHSTDSEQLRFGRLDLNVRYHSIHTQHTGNPATNYIRFKVHDDITSTSQSDVLTLYGSGSVQLNEYSSDGLLKTTGGNGTLAVATGSDLPTGSDAYIQNQVAADQAAGFRINGNGLFSNGNVGVGTASPRGRLHVMNNFVLSSSNGTVRKFASSFSATQSGIVKMGEFTLGGNSHNMLISGRVYGQSGSTAGESEFSIMVRSNTLPAKNIRFWQVQTNAGRTITLRVFHDTNSGLVVVGFTPSASLQSSGWDITVIERGNYNTWMNEDGYTALNTAGLTEITDQGTNHLNLNPGGNVGIGNNSPSYTLHVNGRIGTNAINETSDARLKKDVKGFDNALQKVLDMRGVTYHWKTDEFPDRDFDQGLQYGLIAQELEMVIPELVHTDSEGWKSIEYGHIVPVLIEAIKEQQLEIEQLKANEARIEALEALLINGDEERNPDTEGDRVSATVEPVR